MLIAGCTSAVDEPTATPAAVSTPEPPTPEPTATPQATATRLPLPTPLPTLTPTPTTIPPCWAQYPEYEAAIDLLFDEWNDGVAIAQRTSRVNLNEPIADLQAIRREFDRLDTPECAETLREKGVFYMDTTIDTLISFMGGADGFGGAVDRARAVMEKELRTFYGHPAEE